MLIKLLSILGGIALISLVILMKLHSMYNGITRELIMIVGITIMLNAMIFVVCAISYPKIKGQRGLRGPQGDRGNKGASGTPGKLAVCGDLTISAAEKKHKIKQQKLRLPPKPYITS